MYRLGGQQHDLLNERSVFIRSASHASSLVDTAGACNYSGLMQRKGNYHQAGPENNHWRGGRSPAYYQKLAYAHYGRVCQRCGEPAVLVHHKDEDRSNNSVDNLEPLCKRCHQVFVHDCASNLPDKVRFKPKRCVQCGRTFQPPGPRSSRCDRCLPEKNLRERDQKKRRKQAKV